MLPLPCFSSRCGEFNLYSIALVCIGFDAFARKSQWWERGTWFFKDFAPFASCLIYLLSWGQVPQHLVLEVDSRKVKLTAQQRKQGHKELWKVDQHACDGTGVWTSWSSWSTRPGDVCGIPWGTTLIYFVSRTACPRKIHIFLRRFFQKTLMFSDSGYLEGLPIERRYSYICPKYIIMYRQVCWRVAWENDRTCIRSSPKNTEMYRNHRFFRGALMCSLPGASSCRTAIPWQKRIPYLKRISSPEAMLEVQGVSLRWKQSTLTSMRVSCWSDVQGGSLPSVVFICFCSPAYHLQFRKGFCCHIAIISNYLYLLFAK